jgi:hypothetical protein
MWSLILLCAVALFVVMVKMPLWACLLLGIFAGRIGWHLDH